MSKESKTIQLNTQEESSNTTDNQNYSNIEFRALEGTPFTMVKDEKGYYGVIGTHRVTELYENEEECITEVTAITWDRLIQVIWAVVDKFTKVNINEKLENNG
jgi:hypothetical protein